MTKNNAINQAEIRSFPVLLEISHEGPVDPEFDRPDGEPADIYTGEYFQSDNAENDGIYPICPVCPSPAHEGQPTRTPDGRVAFFSDRDGGRRVYAAQPGQTRPDVLIDRDDLREFRFAPDGKGMAFVTAAADENYRRRLWLAQPDGSQPQPVPAEDLGPFGIEYSPDGRSLLFASWRYGGGDKNGLYQVDLNGPKTVQRAKGDVWNPCFSPDGESVAFIRWDDEEKLVNLDLTTGRERTLVDYCPRWPSSLSYSPDGSRLILTTGELADWDGPDYLRTETHAVPADGGEWREVSCDFLGLIRVDVPSRQPSAAPAP